jgi:glutamyl-Q tRNA(Asp) synthetase
MLHVRLDNIDQTRCKDHFEAAICDDLNWLGLCFEGEPWRQSEHMDDYWQALEKLASQGLVYQADRSRKDIQIAVLNYETRTGHLWPRDPDGAPLYPFAEQDRPHTALARDVPLRLNMAKALESIDQELFWQDMGQEKTFIKADPSAWGDIILARRDCPASYHLASVVDDANQGITHVIRGRDLWAATCVQRLLQALLAWSHRVIIIILWCLIIKAISLPNQKVRKA